MFNNHSVVISMPQSLLDSFREGTVKLLIEVRSPASIRTFHFCPPLVLETRLIFETRLLL